MKNKIFYCQYNTETNKESCGNQCNFCKNSTEKDEK